MQSLLLIPGIESVLHYVNLCRYPTVIHPAFLCMHGPTDGLWPQIGVVHREVEDGLQFSTGESGVLVVEHDVVVVEVVNVSDSKLKAHAQCDVQQVDQRNRVIVHK